MEEVDVQAEPVTKTVGASETEVGNGKMLLCEEAKFGEHTNKKEVQQDAPSPVGCGYATSVIRFQSIFTDLKVAAQARACVEKEQSLSQLSQESSGDEEKEEKACVSVLKKEINGKTDKLRFEESEKLLGKLLESLKTEAERNVADYCAKNPETTTSQDIVKGILIDLTNDDD